jgi:hypothetical protein
MANQPNPFDEFDDPAAQPNPFDEFDVDPAEVEAKQQAAAEAEVRREMAMPAAEYDKLNRERVKAGGYYRPQPTALNLTSDQVTDAIGLGDEIAGAGQWLRRLATTGSLDKAGKAYSDTAERLRAERRVARADNGLLGTAGEIVGGLGTSTLKTVPAGYAAVRAAASAGQTVPQQAAALRAALVPANAAPALGFKEAVAQSAKAGGVAGAAAGAAQGEGGIAERGKEALKGALIGGVAGPVISDVVIPAVGRTVGGVKKAARYASGAVRSAQDPEQAAIENIADRMVKGNIPPAKVRASVSPPPSSNLAGRGFTDADMADIISRSAKGETNIAIAKDYGLDPDTVGGYVKKYQTKNPTPMNIIDIAKETAGEGGAAPMTRLGRAANSLSGDESGEYAQRLIGRQDVQSGRVSNIVQRSVAGGDFEATRAAGLKNLKQEADKAYTAFHAEPDLATDQLSDLMEDPIFRQATLDAQRQARVATIRRNQEATKRGVPQSQLEPVPTVDPETQVFSPEMLDFTQRQLRIASEGRASDPNKAAHAGDLRKVFLDRIEQHYPTFRGIRRNYAEGMGEFGADGALEAGAKLTTKLGAPTREALRDFADYTPAQQELFRLGFARNLMDMAANPQVGGAVANKFNSQAVREIVEELYPKSDAKLWKQGQQLLTDLRREAITTRTKNDVLAGSRTAELNSDMGRAMEGAKAAADVMTGRWGNLLQNLSTRLTTQLGQRGAASVMDILTQTDPAKLLPLLNRLEQAAKGSAQRQQLVHQIRALRGKSSPAIASQLGIQGPGAYNAAAGD